jgi:hypothetical protein
MALTMKKILNLIKNMFPACMVIVLVIFLFIAIYTHIDGLGIFALTLGLIFFTILIYGFCHHNPHGGGGGDENTYKNNIRTIQWVLLHPLFLNVVLSILPAILAFIENNLNKLDKEKITQLESDLSQTLSKINKAKTLKDIFHRPKSTEEDDTNNEDDTTPTKRNKG